MNVVVLDNEEKIVEYVGQTLKEKKKPNTNIHLHTDYLKLRNAFYFKNIDILFIDIRLSDITAIEFVKKNRKYLKHTKIIYMTGYDEYIEDAFDTDPIYFLKKPLTKEKIWKAYDKAIKKLNVENRSIIVTTQKENRIVLVNDIFYIESDARIINIYLQDETITSYAKLSDMEKNLPFYFIRIHKSYLINMNKIKSYKVNQITLENGVSLSISRTYHKCSKIAISDFLKENDDIYNII